jgi:mono/diheme cytochrome c family protein
VKLILVFCTTLLGMVACGEVGRTEAPTEETVVEGFMQDASALARGEALFEGSCAGFCHNLEQSASDAPSLFDCEWKHGGADQEIFDIVTVGVPNTRMVGFGSNFPEGDDDLWKIIAYLRINQQACS